MTEKDKKADEKMAKNSKKEAIPPRKERLASQLRENLLRRKNKEKHSSDGVVSGKME